MCEKNICSFSRTLWSGFDTRKSRGLLGFGGNQIRTVVSVIAGDWLIGNHVMRLGLGCNGFCPGFRNIWIVHFGRPELPSLGLPLNVGLRVSSISAGNRNGWRLHRCLKSSPVNTGLTQVFGVSEPSSPRLSTEPN